MAATGNREKNVRRKSRIHTEPALYIIDCHKAASRRINLLKSGIKSLIFILFGLTLRPKKIETRI
jgi:hypothetical protein